MVIVQISLQLPIVVIGDNMRTVDIKARYVVDHLAVKKGAYRMDPVTIALIVEAIVYFLQLLNAWWFSPKKALDSVLNPGIPSKWLFNRATSSLPEDIKEDAKELILDILKSSTVLDMERMYNEALV